MRNQTRPAQTFKTASRYLRSKISLQWLLLMLFLCTIALLPGGPTWGGEFHIETGPKGIKGYAQHVSLGEVLNYLADYNGYVIQIDQTLLDAPTTFFLPSAIPAEQAIQRIVHPHSLALVFTRAPGNEQPAISEIKVFDKGSQSASFALLSGQEVQAAYTSYAHQGAVRSGTNGRKGVQAGRDAVDRHVRPPVIITKSSMGFTGFKFKDSRSGPDYRPNTITMAKAYANYRAERNALHERSESGKLHTAMQTVEREKDSYRSGRTLSLQQTINDAKK